MKIQKISRIQPINRVPDHHLKWCGVEKEEKKKDAPKVSSGDLILYDRKGKIVIHTDEESK